MKEPKVAKFPTEVFGHPYTENTEQTKQAKDDLQNQYCPFLKTECKKPRKSEPQIKIGTCSVGFKGKFLDRHLPIIVCPHRFDVSIIFQTIQQNYFEQWQNVKWVREVNLGVGGSVDFVAAEIVNNQIDDFLCVEFQAAGTNGSPWQAVLDLKKHGKFQQSSYKFGINWANEFVKTMMQQVYKKGKIVTLWQRKVVFVIQDVGLGYIRKNCDTSGLREKNDDDPIHFCTFKLVWKETFWDFELSEMVSTDIEGINKILGGALEDEYPSVEQFIARIQRKLER